MWKCPTFWSIEPIIYRFFLYVRTEALVSCFATLDMVLQCFGLYDSLQLKITQLPSFPYRNLELWNKMS